ncbi:MAG: ATP-dependent endonuclease [Hyphomicrobiaceae bacterium]
MQLECIQIRNFKGLREVELRPGTFGCLVGENNAGKSSVLQAIVAALSRSGQLPLALHYDPTAPIEFTFTLIGVTDAHLRRLVEEHRAKVAELVINERLTLIVRYPPDQRCETWVIRRTPIDPRYHDETIAGVVAGKRGPAVRAAVAEAYPEFVDGLEAGANIGAAKAHLAAKIAGLPDEQFGMVQGALPTGMGSSITSLLPEPIYIAAVKNLHDDLKTTQSTPFGRLLGLLLEEMRPDLDQIHQSLENLNQMLNRTNIGGEVADRRHPRVRSLEQRIEGFLRDNFPTIKLELNVPPPELRAILNSAQVFVDDGSRDLVDNKGDGIKRSLTFALLQTYVAYREEVARVEVAEGDEEPARRPLMFLFEEPELYLHPRSQRVLFDTLAKISDENQVVVTTHSPLFFAPGVTASFVRVAKQPADPKPIGRLYPITLSLEPDNAEVFRLARFENTDAAFFSRRVVLIEGESDDSFCKHVAKLLQPQWCFDTHGIALVRVSGKGNFRKFRNFFEAFGIEVKLLADVDALFDGYQHLGAPAALMENRDAAIRQIDARIEALAIPAEPSTSQITNRVRSAGWRTRYEQAKQALRQVQSTNAVDPGTIALIDGLFTWEQEIARVKACREDAQARAALTPLLDGLRAAGICVLSRGAIEDYYPPGAEGDQKPQRAIHAISLLNDAADVAQISTPLVDGRACELSEIFAELFAPAIVV